MRGLVGTFRLLQRELGVGHEHQRAHVAGLGGQHRAEQLGRR
jgi:hypothetical protein